MCSAPHDPEFLAKLAQAKDDMTSRMNNYISAWNRGDLETAMDFFVDDGLDYSDYSMPSPSSLLFETQIPSQKAL